tara:strand:- start:493 stop:693 length:201 start_codon:yes stop_codon:yes gene_type:complete
MDGYNVFLAVELARLHNLILADLEYDATWEQATSLYKDFLESPFNVDTASEYDCIYDYFKDLKLKS